MSRFYNTYNQEKYLHNNRTQWPKICDYCHEEVDIADCVIYEDVYPSIWFHVHCFQKKYPKKKQHKLEEGKKQLNEENNNLKLDKDKEIKLLNE